MLLLDLVAAAALAYPTGISGYSGQFGRDCDSCHGGGAKPTVQLTGPSSLDAGETAAYTLTINGGAAVVGGLDVSTPNTAVQFVPGPGESIQFGDLTHIAPGVFDGGVLLFQFSIVAPPTAGTFTVYAAGNSCNDDNTSNGDACADVVMDVSVTGGPMPDGGEVVLPAMPEEGASELLGPTAAGCQAANGGPLSALVVVALRAARRRSRQR